jgi:hypothetical protein
MNALGTWTFAAAVALAAAGMLGPAGLSPDRAAAEAALSPDSPGAPVVVELFTSQGCNSCPPADALLGELAGQPGVIALELHIDYWDYIGWEDPYAGPELTKRQRSYAKRLDQRYVYTPQMVIDGRINVVGSQRDNVLKAIDKAAAGMKALKVRFEQVDGGKIVIPAGHAPDEGAAVWLAVFDRQIETEVLRGENAGRKLVNTNVVRRLTRIGTWRGEHLEIPFDMAAAAAQGRDGCAVIVQQDPTGAVLGAAQMPLEALRP